MLAEAHHVTGLDADSEALAYLISTTLNDARLAPSDISYINAHGTGTLQNDLVETRGIRRAPRSGGRQYLGQRHQIHVRAPGKRLGQRGAGDYHVSLARWICPADIEPDDPDPQCDLDCIPLVGGRHAFKRRETLRSLRGSPGRDRTAALDRC